VKSPGRICNFRVAFRGFRTRPWLDQISNWRDEALDRLKKFVEE